jgi:serine phosphatase RsbU (regulator of sigma subunit)
MLITPVDFDYQVSMDGNMMTDDQHNEGIPLQGDSDWDDVNSRTTAPDDEPRTISYTGVAPRALDRDNAHFVIIEGSEEVRGQRFEVGTNPVVIGRSSKCDVVISDGRISSRHLQLSLAADRLMVEDLNSSNGTYMDGVRVLSPTEFKTNAVIQLGHHILRHEYRSRSEVKRESNLTADLQKARSFIEALLPKPITEGPVKTGWHFVPCATLGGDAFGYHQIDAHRLAIYLLDVCGHGAGAAMLSVSAMNTIRRQSLPNVDFGDPSQVLQGLNDVFQMEDHDGMYFSIWYGVYDQRERKLVYSAAGHPPAIQIGVTDRRPRRLGTKGMAIGIMPICRPPREHVHVEPGDRLYVFSDGVFEIVTTEGKEWSFDEFEQEVIALALPVDQEARRIYDRVKEKSSKKELDDDFSLVVVEFQAG